MSCLCENCGEKTECGEKYCRECFIDIELEDNTERDIYLGGRFSGISLLKEENVSLPGDTVHQG